MIIFLAAPFTAKIQKNNNSIPHDYRDWLKTIIETLRSEGHDVICAHERENWGKEIDTPKVALQQDWDAISESDILVAYIGDPPSPGVQMEIGYASALGKTIVLLHKYDEYLPYLNSGLKKMPRTVYIRFKKLKEVPVMVCNALRKLDLL